MKKILLFLFVFLSINTTPSYAAIRYSKLDVLPYADSSGVPKLAFRVKLLHDAKTYWRNAGEAGSPPYFNWQKSENVSDFKLYFPAPKRFEFMGIDSFGYTDEVIFPADVKIKDINENAILRIDIELLVCTDNCFPEYHKVNIPLKEYINHYLEIRDELQKLPVILKQEQLKASFISQEDEVVFLNLKFKAEDVKDVDYSFDLFVENDAGTMLDTPTITTNEAGEVLVKAKIRYVENIDQAKEELEGKPITYTLSNGNRAYELASVFGDNKEIKKSPFMNFKFWRK